MDLSEPGPGEAPEQGLQSLQGLAAGLLQLPPSCGPVRLIGVDGHAGSGKTSFSEQLAEALGGAPVLHLDDLATHQEPFGWMRRLRSQVLTPLSRGLTAEYRRYDWVGARFAELQRIPAAPAVLVEGVGAGRRALRPALARLIWMELSADAAHARGERRDGPELAQFWRSWRAAEEAHFARDPSRPFAQLQVDGESGRIGRLRSPGRPQGGPSVSPTPPARRMLDRGSDQQLGSPPKR